MYFMPQVLLLGESIDFCGCGSQDALELGVVFERGAVGISLLVLSPKAGFVDDLETIPSTVE